MVTNGGCARPTSQQRPSASLLVRCPRSRRDAMARVVSDASAASSNRDTANCVFLNSPTHHVAARLQSHGWWVWSADISSTPSRGRPPRPMLHRMHRHRRERDLRRKRSGGHVLYHLHVHGQVRCGRQRDSWALHSPDHRWSWWFRGGYRSHELYRRRDDGPRSGQVRRSR